MGVFTGHCLGNKLVCLVVVTDDTEFTIGVEFQPDLLVVINDVGTQAGVPRPIINPIGSGAVQTRPKPSPTGFVVCLMSDHTDGLMVSEFVPRVNQMFIVAVPPKSDGVVFAILAVAYRCSLDGVPFTMGLQACGFVVNGYIVVAFGGLVKLVGFAPFNDFVNPLCCLFCIACGSDVCGQLRQRGIYKLVGETDMLREVHIGATIVTLPSQKFGRVGRANPTVVVAVGNPFAIQVGRLGVLDSARHPVPNEGLDGSRTHRDNHIGLEFRNKPVQAFLATIGSGFLVLLAGTGQDIPNPSGFQEVVRQTTLTLQVPQVVVHLVHKDGIVGIAFCSTRVVTQD